jgi:hypothetical protein
VCLAGTARPPEPLPSSWREPEPLRFLDEESSRETRRRWARKRRKYSRAYIRNMMAMMVPGQVSG